MDFNFLSPFKTTNPYNQSTNIMNHNSYITETLYLKGILYVKDKESSIQKLSENCSLYMHIFNEKTFEYFLILKNNKNSNWNLIHFLIDKELTLFKFINCYGNDCIIIYQNYSFYIFELFKDLNDENKEEIFLEKLEVLMVSSKLKISIYEAKKNNKNIESIYNCGKINNLSSFFDNYFQNEKVKSKSQTLYNAINNPLSLNLNINNFINKNEFMKNFLMYKEVYICRGYAFNYDKYTEEVIPVDNNQSENNLSFLKVNKIGYNNYILVIEENNNIVAFTKIENNIDISIDEKLGTMSFISQSLNSGDNSVYTFSFEDTSPNEINFFKNVIKRCLFEKNNYIEDFSDIRSVSDLCCTDIDIDIDIDYNDDIDDKYSFLSSKSQIIDIGKYFLIKNINEKDNTKNKLIFQTYNNHRTFVIKDNNQIDIFKTNIDDNKLINISSISPIKIKNKNNANDIIISNAKMFNNDNEILFQDSNNKNKIWQYDLNKESVIEDWECDANNSIFYSNSNNFSFNNYNKNNLIDITYPRKLGQLSEKNEMIGINSNSIFLLDGRVNRKNKIANIKNFSFNPNFTSIITTGFGGIAVGAENGDIRLFDDIGKNAKTLLNGLNHSIRYLDSSIDGKYILVTCDKYIMVINTENELNFNGFNTCFGRTNIKPLMLQLSHNDLIKYNIINENFSPAKFNNNTNCKEMMIISSLGQYIILWNFKQVQNGETNLYRIINANEFVIGNTTKFDKNQLIIALSDKIRLQNEELIKN